MVAVDFQKLFIDFLLALVAHAIFVLLSVIWNHFHSDQFVFLSIPPGKPIESKRPLVLPASQIPPIHVNVTLIVEASERRKNESICQECRKVKSATSQLQKKQSSNRKVKACAGKPARKVEDPKRSSFVGKSGR
jgi:hypothetical protein